MKKELLKVAGFSLLVAAFIFLLQQLEPTWIYAKAYWIVFYFFVLYAITIPILWRTAKNNADNFMGIYFSLMIARLFISLGLAFVFIYLDKENKFTFALNFGLLYLLFLGFEIYTLLTNLRHHFETDTVKNTKSEKIDG